MPRLVYLFDPPERFVAGTVGTPGNRTFFLQAREGDRITSVVLEKVQVAVLADRLRALLDELDARGMAVGAADEPADDVAPLDEPLREAFRAHIALAKELGLALQIHDRDAHDEVVAVLVADGAPERTVFHCFSGDAELARTAVAHGWYCSFAGPVSFPKNESLRAALREVPPALLLVETDAPYLTVHPHRGRPNAPYLLPGTVRAVAEATGRALADVCERLSSTAEDVYGSW